MSAFLVLLAATLLAVSLSALAYGWREERVPRRLPAAVLRAIALFLVAGGLFLPSLAREGPAGPQRVVLLDGSRSMALPVDVGSELTRRDSALALLKSLRPERVLLFGDEPLPMHPDSVPGSDVRAQRSRLAPALQAARLAGADSVWVITDGALDDRAEAHRVAERWGLGVRELQVGRSISRVGVHSLQAPSRLAGGDTARVRIEIVSESDSSQLPDSVTVELRVDGRLMDLARLRTPSSGRLGSTELRFVPARPRTPTWQRVEVALTSGGDPLGVSDTGLLWIEVSPESSGAVAISLSANWEPRFLLPVLERTVPGGARGYMEVARGRFLEIGDRPRPVEDLASIQRAIRAARLLVVHADLTTIPDWLAAAMRAHPRKLLFVTGRGDVPGTSIRLERPLDGSWRPVAPPPAGPVSALLYDLNLESLPAISPLWTLQGAPEWTALEGRERLAGESRPLLVGGRSAASLWAVAPGVGYWRWAFRAGEPRRTYEGLISGVVGWLAEDYAPLPLELRAVPRAGEILRWRVGSEVSDLGVVVVDERADTVWSAAVPAPEALLPGPSLDEGSFRILAHGTQRGVEFSSERPLQVQPDPEEVGPRPVGAPLTMAASSEPGDSKARGRRPVWPFLLAALLLCGEWVWRRRIGLR